MRSPLWMLVLTVLVFALGWTFRLVVDRYADTAPPREDAREENRGGQEWREIRMRDQIVGSVDRFAAEIALTDVQREEISKVVKQATNDVHVREQEIRTILEGTQEKVQGLLDETQKARLQTLLRERFESFRRERINDHLAWLATEHAVSTDHLERVDKVLAGYDAEVFELGPRKSDTLRDEIRARRNAALAEVLGAEVAERFVDERLSKHHSRRSDDDDGSRGFRRPPGERDVPRPGSQ